MTNVVIIGCGVIGAAIAYELSLVPGLKITVLDKQPPAQGATGAALGVLMGVISHKVKGKAWGMRQASIQRYETLIPELEASTGCKIPFNKQGILMLLSSQDENTEELAKWENLVQTRSSQGWQLEIWDTAQLKSRCPQLNCAATAAIYSPQDRQVEPAALTLALVKAAQHNGVTFHFGVIVEGCDLNTRANQGLRLKTRKAEQLPLLEADWLVVAAGLGSSQFLTNIQNCESHSNNQSLNSLAESNYFNNELLPQVDIRPVLGQAIHLKLSGTLGNPDFQPVITGDDVHIVPIGEGEYWIGATVEFPTDEGSIVADPAQFAAVMAKAIAFCPALAQATIIKTWSGLRPRPQNRPAPIIERLQSSNILLSTGHYRNGVLLAPATAAMIVQMIVPDIV